MSLLKVKHLLDSAIDRVLDNEALEIPPWLPCDIIEEIGKYYAALNYMASEPFFDIVVIKDMKKEAMKTYNVIKKKVVDDG